jgi:mycobactin salicyl-AMP ligase
MPAASARATISKASAPSLEGLTCAALLSASAGQREREVMLRTISSDGKGPSSLTFGEVSRQSGRLARLLASVSGGQPTTALIAMAFEKQAVLTVLACLRAGITPVVVRPDLDAEQLSQLADHHGASIAIGVDRLAEFTPLLALRDMAARNFGMRCVAGFGSDLPEGVVPLDSFIDEESSLPPLPEARTEGQIGACDDVSVQVTEPEFLALSLEIARALGIAPTSRILTTLVSGNLVSMASGLGAALLTGAEFSPLGLFKLNQLWASFADGKSIHLVAPASIEPAIVQSGLMAHKGLAGLLLVHPTGTRPPGEKPTTFGRAQCRIVDAYPVTARSTSLVTRT